MKIKVDKKIFERYPDVRLGVVFAFGLDNSKKGLFVEKLRSEEAKSRKNFADVELSGHKYIAPWRETYRSFGSMPSEYSSSVEALLKRVVKGKDLSDINPLVNLYNALSLKYVLPFGGEDLDKVKGDIRLAFADGSETGIYLGSEDVVGCDVGEVAYLDDLGFICRRWNWREGKRTMLTEDTKNVVLVIEAVPDVSDEELKLATEEMAGDIKLSLGGKTNVYYLDENNMEVEVDFETGTSLSEIDNKKLETVTKNKIEKQAFDVTKRGNVPTSGISGLIYEVVKKVCLTESFLVERPSDGDKGDFASNVAMVMAKTVGKDPRELAEEIVLKLKKSEELGKVVDLERIEVAGAGFINFWVRDEYLVAEIASVQNTETRNDIGGSDWMEGKKVLVEYSSPNIAKRFSVGHLRSTIIGQALFNLYKASGAEVTNDNHLGDWGTQFGMIIAAVEEENLDISTMSIGELEELYVRFNKHIEERPELKDKAREAFLRLEQGDVNARKIWQLAIDVSMSEFEEIYKKLEVNFVNCYGESEYEKMMPQIVADLKDKGIATEGERGATIIKFEKDAKEYMPVAMLLKSDGSTTYLTRDLATVRLRLDKKELNANLYIYEVGAEQKLHFRQVFDTARRLWPEETKNIEFVHVAHGLLTLPEGKMSTRKGNTIKLEDLLSTAENLAWSKTFRRDSEKDGGWGVTPEERLNKDVEMIKDDQLNKNMISMGLNAVKYNELRRSPGLNYIFRWEEALAMEGNSAPYINYAYVRAKKIVGDRSSIVGAHSTSSGFEKFEGEEKELARFLMRYLEGEVVEEAAKSFSPNVLANYLFEVAKRFNGFYDRNKVLGDVREKPRLVLVKAIVETLKTGMRILGIEVVEKM